MKLWIIMLSLLWLSGCATSTYKERTTAQGAAIGSAAGAVIGAQSDHAVEGAVIGGALGAIAGAIIAEEHKKLQRTQAAKPRTYCCTGNSPRQQKDQDDKDSDEHRDADKDDDDEGYI